jgi:hypothetical protein
VLRPGGIDVAEVVDAVDRLTRRAGADPVARRVKLADIEDNLDLRRLRDGARRPRPREPLPARLAPPHRRRGRLIPDPEEELSLPSRLARSPDGCRLVFPLLEELTP